jgi:hypothetical protein
MTRSLNQNKVGIRNGLVKMTDDELVLLRAGLDAEMRKRKIAFTVGDVGERLVIEHFRKTSGLPKLQSAPRNTKNVDAISRDGERYSIKTRRSASKARKTGTIYQPEQDKDKQLFEYLLIVQLAEDWSLESIHQLAWKDFVKVRSRDKRMTAWYVAISQRTLGAAKLIYQAPGKNA